MVDGFQTYKAAYQFRCILSCQILSMWDSWLEVLYSLLSPLVAHYRGSKMSAPELKTWLPILKHSDQLVHGEMSFLKDFITMISVMIQGGKNEYFLCMFFIVVIDGHIMMVVGS